uniref:Ataxin-10 n=1 Tax=Oryctolagus cuniculus TaxID=9986 RepID=G1U6L4_RABIT
MAAPRPRPTRMSGVMVPAPMQDLEALRALRALFKEPWNREAAPRTIFQRVLDILKKSSRAVELACRDPSQAEHLASSLQLITECFRCLRSARIECSVNQNSIRNLDTVSVAVDLILLFRELRVEQESLLTAFRCGLQFLGNIASRNEDSQAVWMHAFPELFISYHFLKSPELVQAMYAKLSNQERVTLLGLVVAKLIPDDLSAFLRHAELMASSSVDQCRTVLKLMSEQHPEDAEVLATARLPDVLCEMTANTELLGYLQVFPGFWKRHHKHLHTCDCIKEGDVSSVAEGFKSHLIRLIGNLCYKIKDNQDKVNELDGIPLILDSCRIDDNNLFLTQWVVYAIRNLTEDNVQNQDVIAKMEDQGLADTSLLKKMGFEVEKRGGKLILKSIKYDQL